MKIINKQLLLFLSIVLLSSCTVFYDDALPNQEISKYPERVGVINKAITETLPACKKTYSCCISNFIYRPNWTKKK